MPEQVPDGNLPGNADWIHRNAEDRNVDSLRHWLEKYKIEKYPDFKTEDWLRTIGGLRNVSDRTPGWCQERAELLLDHLENRHKLDLLHAAFKSLKAQDQIEYPSTEDKLQKNFVVNQLIQGNPDLAFQPHRKKQSAFMLAASRGLLEIVDHVLTQLSRLFNDDSSTSDQERADKIFSKLKEHDGSNNTALGLAVEEGHAKIVQKLLDKDKRLAGQDHLTNYHIKEAIGKRKTDIVNMILKAQPDVAKRLPELIVEHGDIEMWEALAHLFEKHLYGSDILHLAVQKRKRDIINWLVTKFPQMAIEKDKRGKIALCHNDNHADKENIRRLIVSQIVRLCNHAEMKSLLQMADDTPRQASLDLRVFNQATHDFAQFIELVKVNLRTPSGLHDAPDPAPNIKFESVLRYVHFPDLSQEALSKDAKIDRQEVSLVLQWLRLKGVKSIMKLIVPDCRENPLDEEQICECLKDFEIEELNWRRLDLGVEPIVSLAPTIAVLHLYSSGNWAVIDHWVSEGGLKRLRKLKTLHIVFVEECMTRRQADNCWKRICEGMGNLKPKLKIEKWSHGTTPMQKVAGVMSATGLDEKSASSCIELDAFVGEYTNIQQERYERTASSMLKPLRKIKVALIDTGIGAMADTSHLQIMPGISFGHGADGETESPWFIPTNEHGPQMADIICSIDPYCEIYPVKITDDDDNGAVRASPVINAIKWATEQCVDIISLSLVLFNSHQELIDAVDAANKKNIVILCSTADRGNNHQKVYPAQYWKEKKVDCLIPIAGCDKNGKLTDYSTETDARYYFLGKDVTAKSVQLMRNSSKEISGSSVATAIAAGTASLVLACSFLALDEGKHSNKQRIEIFFELMQTEQTLSQNLKYVEPAILFGEKSVECVVKQMNSKLG